jgi:hypothetical protein
MRYKATYDEKGMAYEYEDGVCIFVREDLKNYTLPRQTATVMGDIQDFVSPIDGTVVSGRAGLREHCLKHNVVPTAELKGLPMKTMNMEHQSSPEYREATKRTMAEIINSRRY